MNDGHKAVAGKLRSAAAALRADAGSQVQWSTHNALVREAKAIEDRADELDPPKPAIEEPTELGAVVVDSQGCEYVRHTRDSLAPWIAAAPKDLYRPYRYFKDLDVVEVLRIGVGGEPQIYDRTGAKHKQSCEWPECPGNEDCEGLSLLSEKTLDLTASVGDTTADAARDVRGPSWDGPNPLTRPWTPEQVAAVDADVDEFMTSAGFTFTPGQKVAYKWGARDTRDRALAALRFLRKVAITAEQTGAYEKAIKAIGDLP